MNKKLIPISIAIFLVGMLPFLAFAQTIQRVENNGNLILEDIPPIPESIKSDLVQYQNVRSGAFRGFDQTGKNIFISTRFGNVSQLHNVKQPGGARNQITYFDEPIGSVSRQPKGHLITFTMDSGGSENDQIYILNPLDGTSRMISDGKSRNGGPLWDRSGQRLSLIHI